MNFLDQYLDRSLHLLEKWIPFSVSAMEYWFSIHPDDYTIEMADGLTFCLFSWPVLETDGKEWNIHSDSENFFMERCILLVYQKNEIIADMSGFHADLKNLCTSPDITAFLQKESDWLDLEQYVLSGICGNESENGEGMIFANAYVTRSLRQRGIFAAMEQMMKEYALRHREGSVIYSSVLSLDPDIACYGPDTVDEPYIYSWEKDEPVRILNETISRRLGYEPVRLERLPDNTDGTKICFAVKKEEDQIISVDQRS